MLSGAPFAIGMLLCFAFLVSLVLFLGASDGEKRVFWSIPTLGHFLIEYILMLILSLGLALYAIANEPMLMKWHLRSFHILTTMVVMVFFIRLVVFQEWSPYLMIVPIMITGITLTIIYNQRFALGMSGYLLLFGMLAMSDSIIDFREGLGVLLASGCSVGISIMMLKKIRSFTKLIEVSAIASIMVFLVVFVFGLWMNKVISETLIDCLYASGGVLAVGFLMQGLLPLIERVFQTATDMSLLSYGEATQPLLKRLAVEAPGTFNHSWQIGMLSDAAAEAIGANGLLCRVGCYYHDVGKLNKPRYFIENQQEGFNQHKELSPTMSRMIIVGHVKIGRAHV